MTQTRAFSFMKFRALYFVISLLVIVPGLFSLVKFGLRPSIDFTGGSLIEMRFEQPVAVQDINREKFQEVIGPEVFEISSVQMSGENQVIVRGKPISDQQKNQVGAKVFAQFGPARLLRFETVGPTLGQELVRKALIAAAIVSVGITLYVWRQFNDLKYGVSAVLAMFHDTLVLLGAFSLLGHFKGVEVDQLFVTALLTTLSFSVHDTIVVYDRIRETLKKNRSVPFVNIVDAAVLETLGRSINNSMTIIIMLATLALLGGETIRWFVVALLIGAVTGTYSSTFTAAPLLLLWDDVKKRMGKK